LKLTWAYAAKGIGEKIDRMIKEQRKICRALREFLQDL
jgi:hypothetical protein